MAGGQSATPGIDKPDIRVVAVGDDLVAGMGDPRSQGWLGRVGARTPRTSATITIFPLGVPQETTADLLARWQGEAMPRFTGVSRDHRRLVIGLGRADVFNEVSIPRSRLNIATLLDECVEQGLPAFVVGPPPGPDGQQNKHIAELSAAFADVCARRQVTYVDTFEPLINHEDWLTDMAAGNGKHPEQHGYGLMAWLVLHAGWNEFLGIPDA